MWLRHFYTQSQWLMHIEEHNHCFMHYFGVKKLSGTLFAPPFNETGYGARHDQIFPEASAALLPPRRPTRPLPDQILWPDAWPTFERNGLLQPAR